MLRFLDAPKHRQIFWTVLFALLIFSVSFGVGQRYSRLADLHNQLNEKNAMLNLEAAEYAQTVSDLQHEVKALNRRVTNAMDVMDQMFVVWEAETAAYKKALHGDAREVCLTVYSPTVEQCDSSPDITADGSRINLDAAGQHRFLAVSRDLHERYGGELAFGDSVYVSNAGSLDGFYEVRDLMNSRYTDRVDILTSIGTPPYKFDNALLTTY